MKMRVFLLAAMVGVLLLSSACGGGNAVVSPPPPPPVTYTIGGTVFGLSGTGLILQNNQGDNLPVSATGGFTFTTSITSGDTYNVTVFTQPSGPAQNCTVINGGGPATANVTSVAVACVSDWIWENGLTVVSTYGPYGSFPPGNMPGARENAEAWTDPDGNFWLFGGDANYAVSGGYIREPLSDLWEYNAGQWTLVSGTKLPCRSLTERPSWKSLNYRSNHGRGITVDGGGGASLHSPQGVV
jgi:hypothetical protein